MKRVIVILLAILVVLLGVWVWVLTRTTQSSATGNKPSAYSAVYLSTGDIYFGKLSWFPKTKLADAWLLQRTIDASERTSYVLVPFRSALWEPVGTIWLNPEQIVFWTRVRAGSNTERELMNIAQENNVPQTPAPPSSSGR